MRLLVGLGNPGPSYAANRHNIGFMAVAAISHRHGFSAPKNRFDGSFQEGEIAGERVLALRPLTYMTASGRSVAAASNFFKIEPADIIVLHDEIELVFGKLRVKRGGGAAGHNGLRSIDAAIGPDYWRVRMGVDHPGHPDLVHRHVLSDFSAEERPVVEKFCFAVADAMPLLLRDLARGEPNGFLNKVNITMNPPAPRLPKEKKAPKAEESVKDKAGGSDEDQTP
jgi:peptidyl-tRNA hydrolase, PTH1 family